MSLTAWRVLAGTVEYWYTSPDDYGPKWLRDTVESTPELLTGYGKQVVVDPTDAESVFEVVSELILHGAFPDKTLQWVTAGTQRPPSVVH